MIKNIKLTNKPVTASSENSSLLSFLSSSKFKIISVKLSEFLESLRKLFTNLLITIVLLIITGIVLKEIFDDSVIIEPISIPKELEAHGYTPENIALQLIDTIQRVHNEAWTAKDSIRTHTDSRHTDIEVPGTKTTLKSIIKYIKYLFNINNDTRISGEIILHKEASNTTNNKYIIILRVKNSEKDETINIEDINCFNPEGAYANNDNIKLKCLLYSAAQHVTHATDPIVYASHQYFYLRSILGKPSLEEIISKYKNSTNNDEKSWAKYFEAIVNRDNGRYIEAVKLFDEAINLNKSLADAYNDLAEFYYYDQYQFYDAIDILQTGINNVNNRRLKSLLYIQWSSIIESKYVDERSKNTHEIANVNSPQYENPIETIIEDAHQKCLEAENITPYSYEPIIQEGNILYKKGLQEMAKEKYELALQISPSYKYEIYNHWGWAILQQNNNISLKSADDAIKKFEIAKNLKQYSAEPLINLGYAYLYKSKHDYTAFKNGENSFKLAEEKYHDKIYVNFEYGRALSYIGHYDLAIEKYYKASKGRPDNVNYTITLGEAYYTNGETDKAADTFKEAIEREKNRKEKNNAIYFYNAWGNILFRINRFDEAAEKYRDAIQINPGVAIYHTNLGDALVRTNQTDQGIAAYEKAISLNPKSAETYNKLGNALYTLKDWESAAEKYREAINLIKNESIHYSKFHASIYYSNFGEVLIRSNRISEGESAFIKSIEINSNDPETYNRWGNSLYNLAHWESAAEKYRNAINIKNTEPIYFSNLGDALIRSHHFEDGESAFNQAIKLNPYDPETYNVWGNALYSNADWKSAAEKYRKATNIKNDPVYFSNLGETLIRSEQFKEGITAFNQAVKINPSDPETFNRWANALYDMGKYEDAINKYNQAITLEPNESSYYRNLSLALSSSNRPEEADKAYAKAIAIEEGK